MRTAAPFLTALLLAATAQAQPPRVAADIAPVHSLAAQVMAGLGTPELIVPPGASPHHYALKPSQSGALARAELLIRVGGGYTPWLEDAAAALAPDAAALVLLDAPGTAVLPLREDVVFDTAPNDTPNDTPQDTAQDPAQDPAREAAQGAAHEETANGRDREDLAADPHAWLDPGNAAAWTRAIAEALAAADPANAATYRANADEAVAALEALDAELRATLRPVAGRPYVVLHDAFQYFGAHYGVDALGAIAAGDNAAPGPRRIDAIRDTVADHGVTCIFAEPQQDTRLIDLAAEGAGARVGRLDPLGAGIPTGPGHYAATMRALADGLAGCLAQD
ncbi:zinc transporter [Rhodobacteraceae bacterium 2CG4]|uniref:High-affinity zinc uptake system protein ZnuA n=1 Tax=Halovulum marinum TaxID=2662447 RepID=A0A6L5Z338_9RHOB|nr:zinc ABC transporter substrate-binding protein [Halovulum marinum]MSU91011.1 zinc transporter [Halovulum marinum]